MYCKNWADTVAFYQNKLRLQINYENEWFVEFKLTDDARLSIANEKEASIKSGQGIGITISIEVEDLTAMHSMMKESGLTPTAIRDIWESKHFFIYDPEGNRIEFWS